MKFQTISLEYVFAAKGAIYYVAIATVIFSHVKITSCFHVWRYHVFVQKLTWYFIGVYNNKQQYFVSSSDMFSDKKTLRKIWLNPALQFPKIPLGKKVECHLLNSKCHIVKCRGTKLLKLVTVNERGDKGWNRTCVNPFITNPAQLHLR